MRFATKPAIAAAMARRAENAEVPFAWGAADSIYGVGELEMSRRRAGKGYVLGIASSHLFNSWRADLWISGTAPAIAQSLPADDDVRLSAGAAAKSSRLYQALAPRPFRHSGRLCRHHPQRRRRIPAALAGERGDVAGRPCPGDNGQSLEGRRSTANRIAGPQVLC